MPPFVRGTCPSIATYAAQVTSNEPEVFSEGGHCGAGALGDNSEPHEHSEGECARWMRRVVVDADLRRSIDAGVGSQQRRKGKVRLPRTPDLMPLSVLEHDILVVQKGEGGANASSSSHASSITDHHRSSGSSMDGTQRRVILIQSASLKRLLDVSSWIQARARNKARSHRRSTEEHKSRHSW